MNTKEINQVLDKEIEFSRNSPLAKTLDSQFVDGFIKGLEQAKYLIGASGFLDTLDTCLRSDKTRGLFITGKRGSGKTTKLVDAIRHVATNYAINSTPVIVPTSQHIKRIATEICKDSNFTLMSNCSQVNMKHQHTINIYSNETLHRLRGTQFGIVFIDDIEYVNTDMLNWLYCEMGKCRHKLIVAGTELPTNPNLGILTGYHL